MVVVRLKTVGVIVVLLATQYAIAHIDALRHRLQLRSNAQLETRESSFLQLQTKSQFIDTLLMGILQMLLNSGSVPGMPQTAGAGAGQTASLFPQLPAAQSQVPEPVLEEEEEEVPSAAPAPTEERQNRLQQQATALSNLSPETLISKALNAQQNQMGALNKQIALLANEVTEWKDLKAKALAAGQQVEGQDNQIQLTIRYPGTGANETQAAIEEQKEKQEEQDRAAMMDLAGASPGVNAIDPSTLRVPVFVVAPKVMSDYSAISSKAIRDTMSRGKDASIVRAAEQDLLVSPVERQKLHRQQIKTALANAAFFANDKKVTLKRLESLS